MAHFSFGGGGGFPGGHPFAGMGGMGGGGRREPVDNETLYKNLGVSKTATASEIKKAYHKMARTNHPDKGGDPELFKQIQHAYDVLSDDNKRSAYDRGGEDALDGAGGMGDSPGDIFDLLSGRMGGGGRGGAPKKKRTKDVVQTIEVTLEQAYNGHTKKMAVTRDLIDKSADVKSCSACRGQGFVTVVQSFGPMMSQSRQPCETCQGQGTTFKTKTGREVLEVMIPKGCPNGHQIVFHGKADEHPNAETGDVIFEVQIMDHQKFIRKGADLFIHKKIPLLDALTGIRMELTHLDGRKLIIKSKIGDVIKPLNSAFLEKKDLSSDPHFDKHMDMDIGGEDVAQVQTAELETITKLAHQKGFTGFTCKSGVTTFKRGDRSELMATKKKAKGTVSYVICDPLEAASKRLHKACKGEGMPTFKNPFQFGNLFILFDIEFPTNLTEDAQKALRAHLPSDGTKPEFKDDDDSVEIHALDDIDPVTSYQTNLVNDGNAYDEDERGAGGVDGGGVQCAQQ